MERMSFLMALMVIGATLSDWSNYECRRLGLPHAEIYYMIVGGSTRRRRRRRLAAKRQEIGTTMQRQNGAGTWLIAGHTCMEKKLNDVKAYSKGWKSKVNASMF